LQGITIQTNGAPEARRLRELSNAEAQFHVTS